MTPPFVDAEHIRRQADGGAYERGVAYFRDGAVRTVALGPGLVGARVGGRRQRPDRLSMPDPPRPGPTRPADRLDLLHVPDGARLQAHGGDAAREQSARGSPVAGDAAPAPRRRRRGAHCWRRRAPDRLRRPPSLSVSSCASGCGAARSQWAPTRVESASPRGSAPARLRRPGRAAPLERSARSDAWIKGSVSWEAVRRPGHPYVPAQARWFAELYSIARDMRLFGAFSDVSEWVTLDDIESHLLWPHLATAAEHGIAVVPTKKHTTVAIAAAAEVVVRAEQTPDGLALAARLSIDDEPVDADEVRPIGHIGVYRFTVRRDRIELTLAPVPLPAPVHALVDRPRRRHRARRGHAGVPDASTCPGSCARSPSTRPGSPCRRPSAPSSSSRRDSHPRTGSTSRSPGATASARRCPIGLRCPTIATARPRTRSARGSRRSGRMPRPSPFAASGQLSGHRRRRVRRRGCCPRSRRSPTSRSRSRASARATASSPADPHVTVSTVETHRCGLVRPRRHRHDRRAHDPVRAAVHRAHAGDAASCCSATAATSRSRIPSLQRLRDLIEEAGELTEWETGPRISRYQTALWADFEDVADQSEPAVSWRATAEALRDIDRIPPTPLPAGLHARAAPLPAHRLRLARVPLAAPPRRHPRRRHGPRQDDPDARADRAHARERASGGRSSSWRRPPCSPPGAPRPRGSPRICGWRSWTPRARSGGSR